MLQAKPAKSKIVTPRSDVQDCSKGGLVDGEFGCLKGENAYIGVALLYTHLAHGVQGNWKAQSRGVNRNRALSPAGAGGFGLRAILCGLLAGLG